MKIVTPENFNEAEKEQAQSDKKQIEITYEPTEKDEEKFFLMYHMNIQPSEVDAMADDYRQWVVARFIGQKQMEREMVQQEQIRRQVMPNLTNLRTPE